MAAAKVVVSLEDGPSGRMDRKVLMRRRFVSIDLGG